MRKSISKEVNHILLMHYESVRTLTADAVK